ncbi:OB-fold domain-containing protein [Candidatus Roizmanbacteria bacterium]|nr:OB-fold domain-containing protein [Candidatus Roizmanbacteria bacterium]
MNNSPVKIWRNQSKIRSLLGKRGTIVSFTTVRVPPAGFEDQAPYSVILVQLDEQCVVGQLVDYDAKHLRIGQAVVAVLRRVKTPGKEGIIPYGVKFRPL